LKAKAWVPFFSKIPSSLKGCGEIEEKGFLFMQAFTSFKMISLKTAWCGRGERI